MDLNIKQFENIPNQREIDLEYLRNSKLPLVLYGIKSYAHSVKKLLDENNLKIDTVVIDSDYYKKEQLFCGFEVKIIDEVLNSMKKMNIVFGFNTFFSAKIEHLSKYKQVKKCLFLATDSFKDCFLDNNFFNDNINIFNDLYASFEDDYSRNVMKQLVEARISKNCYNINKLKIENEYQYFPPFLKLADNEIFVDCGAYTGDTIEVFLKKTNGKFDSIYAFECDENNLQKLHNTMQYNKPIHLINKGVYSEKNTLYFTNDGTSSSQISITGDTKIETDTIDNVLNGNPCTFIKMDIEGAELKALYGAEKTIKKYKPKLAICVYHRKEDLITIPQYIRSLRDDYRLFLRHYGDFFTETVLYAM